MKYNFAFALAFTLLLTGCTSQASERSSSTSANVSSTSVSITESVPEASFVEAEEPSIADGYDFFGDETWEVVAFTMDGKRVSVEISDTIQDLYDSEFLNFYADGTFQMIRNVFITEGIYVRLDEQADGYERFLLKSERTFRPTMVDGELQEQESTSPPKDYIIIIQTDGTFSLGSYDSNTGAMKADEEPLYYGTETDTLQAPSVTYNENAPISTVNPNHASGNSSQPQSTPQPSSATADGSYQSILDEYTTKMENAVDGLIQEYKTEAAGVSDIEKKAEIVNSKIEKLAEIANEGVEKMAELHLERDDSYDTYSNWAEKLMDNYTDIATEIMNAYLNLAF